MKLKRFAAFFLVTVLVLSLLAGCNTTPNETTTAPTSAATTQATTAAATEATTEAPSKEIVFPLEEKMEFTGFTHMANTWYYADNEAWQYALERGNIHIELTEVMNSEIVEKGNTLMNSGDYPEVLFKCSSLDLDSFGMEGLLIPLEDLIREYAPNLTALLDERNGWAEITAPDGHIYSLPKIGIKTCNIGTSGPIWMNQRWLENVGLDMPTSMEELYEVLKAFKEKDANGNGDPNDEIPFSYAGGTTKIIQGLSLLMEDLLLYKGNYFGVSNGEFCYYPVTDSFKNEFLPYFAKLYAEGLMDQNSLVQTSTQFNALGKTGDVIGTFQRASLSLVLPEYAMDYLALESYNAGGYPLGTGINKGGLALTDKCKNPEVLVAWADWFYTEEGGKLLKIGLEGKAYTLNDDGTFTPHPERYENLNYQATLNGLGAPVGWIPEYCYTHEKNVGDISSESNAYANLQLVERQPGTILPFLQLTVEEKEKTSIILADIEPYVENYTARVISGEVSIEDTWDDYQKTLKDMGLDELVSIYQGAYARATEK